jgi:hypothetical protein
MTDSDRSLGFVVLSVKTDRISWLITFFHVISNDIYLFVNEQARRISLEVNGI